MYSWIFSDCFKISQPLIFAVPAVVEILPVRILIRVVFPAPLCPRIVNNSPFTTSINTLRLIKFVYWFKRIDYILLTAVSLNVLLTDTYDS